MLSDLLTEVYTLSSCSLFHIRKAAGKDTVEDPSNTSSVFFSRFDRSVYTEFLLAVSHQEGCRKGHGRGSIQYLFHFFFKICRISCYTLHAVTVYRHQCRTLRNLAQNTHYQLSVPKEGNFGKPSLYIR